MKKELHLVHQVRVRDEHSKDGKMVVMYVFEQKDHAQYAAERLARNGSYVDVQSMRVYDSLEEYLQENDDTFRTIKKALSKLSDEEIELLGLNPDELLKR